MFRLRTVGQRALNMSRRRFAGHGHGHGHGDEAQYFLGAKPTDPMEGWEVMAFTFVALSVIVAAAPGDHGDKTLEGWAREEAIARREALANGETVEFGKFLVKDYTAITYEDEQMDE